MLELRKKRTENITKGQLLPHLIDDVPRPFQQRLVPSRIHTPALEIELQQFQRCQPFWAVAQTRSPTPLDILADASNVEYGRRA